MQLLELYSHCMFFCMPSTPAVVTEGLTRRFGDFTAVDSLDLEVATGSVFAILGPNGAGKTTTVRMLATLTAPTSGRAVVCGHDVVTEAEQVRRALSLTGQFAALEDNLTCRENLVLMARLRGHSRKDAGTITDRLIERFDITEFADKLVKSVSGGQRRRTDLAASLVIQPQLLVLDEPTTGLDPRSRMEVWSSVRELVSEGVTVLLTTQYLEEADELADQVVLIDHGRAVASGTPFQLKAQIGEQRVDVVTSDLAGLRHPGHRAVRPLHPHDPPRAPLAVDPRPRRDSRPGRRREGRPRHGRHRRRAGAAPADARRRLPRPDGRAPAPAPTGVQSMTTATVTPRRFTAVRSACSRDRVLPDAHPRVPERLLDVTLQPIVFTLLFLYVFGSALHIPTRRGTRSATRTTCCPAYRSAASCSASSAPASATANDFASGVIDRFRSLPVHRLAVILPRRSSGRCSSRSSVW